MTVPTRPDVTAVLADGSLTSRVALVTGGGSGIGRATALLLARLGARVVVVGRRPETLEETVAMAGGADVVAQTCDVREQDQVDPVLDQVMASHGGIDILVNNAGGQFLSPAESISPKGFRAVTRLNLDAVHYLTTSIAARSMIPGGYGKVISVTMTPHRGIPGMSHSSAARAAVESLTSTWAAEWGRYGIRTVAVAPGIVHTAAWEGYGLDPAAVAKAIPLQRLQAADEVATVIAFLAGPAGDYVTGTVITVDGGLDVIGGVVPLPQRP